MQGDGLGMYCCFCHLLLVVERILPSHTASLERNGVRSGSDDLVTLFRSLERALHQYPLVCRIFAYNMCIKLLRNMCPPFLTQERISTPGGRPLGFGCGGKPRFPRWIRGGDAVSVAGFAESPSSMPIGRREGDRSMGEVARGDMSKPKTRIYYIV